MMKFDQHVCFILGRPNFAVAPIAHVLRKAGQEIKTKAEDEQAAGIYWMLCLYEKHGDSFYEIADDLIKGMKNGAIKLNKQGEIENGKG